MTTTDGIESAAEDQTTTILTVPASPLPTDPRLGQTGGELAILGIVLVAALLAAGALLLTTRRLGGR
ncbi:hypothetical protein [Protaetiibacter mangrovi]|uniref:LPXTG cell wall anchor domain-containing protein n=1 Tax=Protaetiibacter mangrovi TaxID=2970926 RepID=A0ABT1ZDE2_9MICO|nr:hypothetical protein [Protaetiibacter mangrovi]MCS0498719.1 hypothetical protein [Protaetiibacter mangrovi]TPX02998.1 hypothetical protein FJ656_19490 [Schumannella luteola]